MMPAVMPSRARGGRPPRGASFSITRHTVFGKTIPPLADQQAIGPQLLGDDVVGGTVGRSQNDLRSENQA